MDDKEFMKLQVGDRIETKAGAKGTVARVYVENGYPFATVHFDGDPPSKTFTTWPSVVIEKLNE